MEVVYWTMKELGKVVGLSSHQVGRKLKELGLRTTEGRPSQEAFEKGWVAPRWTADGQHYLWAWDKAKALDMLKSIGIEPTVDPAPVDPE